MEIPKLGNGKFVVITAELKTGVILNNDYSYYLNVGDDYYLTAASREDAIDIATKRVAKRRDLEVLIYDENGIFLEVISSTSI